MSFSLERFGWDGVTVPAELKEIGRHLPTAANLKLLRNPQTMGGAEVYFPFNFFHKGPEKYMPAYMKDVKLNDGGYATVYKGKRAIFKQEVDEHTSNVLLQKHGNFEPICIKKINLNILPDEEAQTPRSRTKTYEEEVNAILYEAYIHAVICKVFERAGYPNSVPYLHEVCAISKDGTNSTLPTNIDNVWLVMELLQGTTLEKFLKNTLRVGEFAINDNVILDVILQIAFYLKLLQENLHFNHRDMKINNVFVRNHSGAWTRSIPVPTLGSWRCKNDVVLIDYGFACISCGPGAPNPRATLLGAGSWFCQEHDCMKYGRDLGQFLFSIHCHFPFEKYFSPWLVSILKTSMTAKKGALSIDVLKGFENNGTPRTGSAPPVFNDGIYHFLRDNSVDIPGCRPETFLKTVTEAFKSRP
jgi:serine/threonine protein kinase